MVDVVVCIYNITNLIQNQYKQTIDLNKLLLDEKYNLFIRVILFVFLFQRNYI